MLDFLLTLIALLAVFAALLAGIGIFLCLCLSGNKPDRK